VLPSPPLTDPDERISRIRFFARNLRSRTGVMVDDQGWRQWVPSEHGPEAYPRQMAMASASSEPFLPDPQELVVVPANPPAVSRDAIVGAVPPDHPRQVSMLFAERAMQVLPAPFRYRSQRASITVFGRYLPNHVLTVPRQPPDVGEAKKVEGGPHRGGMPPAGAFEPEVYEAGLGRVEPKPKAAKALAQYVQQSLAGPMVLEGDHGVIGVADQLTPPFPARPHRRLEPHIQHVMQIEVREQRRDHPALGRATSRSVENALFEHPRLQPFIDHSPNNTVRNSLVEKASQVGVIDDVEGSGDRLPIAGISPIR
jgi:hypothetical protein